ncbi:hypothetical protein BLA29_004632, partial [Euroglyphus maynei]
SERRIFYPNKYEPFSTTNYLRNYYQKLLPYVSRFDNDDGDGDGDRQASSPLQQEFDLRYDADPLLSNADAANILLNRPEGGLLSKYKNSNRPTAAAAAIQREQIFNPKQTIGDDELNRLFVSIQNIQPPIDERNVDYLYDENNRATEQLLDFASFIGNQKQHPSTTMNDDNVNYGKLDFNQKWKLQKHPTSSSISSNHERPIPVYREENMAIPYDEIEQTKKRKETKENIINNGDDNQSLKERKRLQAKPSNVMINQHSMQEPKSYQQSIMMNRKDSIESKFSSLSDIYFIAIVACVSTVAIFSVIGAGYCFYKVQQSNKAAADVDFPAYGVIGPVSRSGGDNNTNNNNDGNKCTSPNNDRKLVQSAQIYHYHHQKQQMISTEK